MRQRIVSSADPWPPTCVGARQPCADALRGRRLGAGKRGKGAQAWRRCGFGPRYELGRVRRGRVRPAATHGNGSGGAEVSCSPHSGLGAVADTDVIEDAREVRLHGALGDAEFVGDDAVGHAIADESEYFELA